MVSLESLSSVEHGTKMIFLIPFLKVVIELFKIVDGIPLFLFTTSVFFDQIYANFFQISKTNKQQCYW